MHETKCDWLTHISTDDNAVWNICLNDFLMPTQDKQTLLSLEQHLRMLLCEVAVGREKHIVDLSYNGLGFTEGFDSHTSYGYEDIIVFNYREILPRFIVDVIHD